MNVFGKALLAEGKSALIPEEHNLYGRFVGEWDFTWVDGKGTAAERHIPGEWIFSWVLEGTAVQDVWICPSREARKVKTYPDAAYGSTMRLYNPAKQAWDVFYGETGQAALMEGRKEGDRIVQDGALDCGRRIRWIFSDITDDSFHWEHLYSDDDGASWQLKGAMDLRRR